MCCECIINIVIGKVLLMNANYTGVLLYEHFHRLGKMKDTYMHFGAHLYPRVQVWYYYVVHRTIYVTRVFNFPVGPVSCWSYT